MESYKMTIINYGKDGKQKFKITSSDDKLARLIQAEAMVMFPEASSFEDGDITIIKVYPKGEE